MPQRLIRAAKRITQAYGMLGSAILMTAIILIIVGVVWAALHDQLF
jgi:hypothetical protein